MNDGRIITIEKVWGAENSFDKRKAETVCVHPPDFSSVSIFVATPSDRDEASGLPGGAWTTNRHRGIWLAQTLRAAPKDPSVD
jgi:hypothetical protein